MTNLRLTRMAPEDAVAAYVDVVEAADRVHHGLGGHTGAGFSEACFQAALSSELVGSQREVIRPVTYYCQSAQKHRVVGSVRFDVVYGPCIIEMKSYRTKNRSAIPPQLQAQLAAYKCVLAPTEMLVVVLFWKDMVDVFQYR